MHLTDFEIFLGGFSCSWRYFFNLFFKTIFKKWPQAYTHSILDTRLKKKRGSGSQKLKRQHRSKHPITTGLQTTNTVNKNKILGQMLIRSNASFSFWLPPFSFVAATLELLSGIILCCALFLYLFAALFHSLEFNYLIWEGSSGSAWILDLCKLWQEFSHH